MANHRPEGPQVRDDLLAEMMKESEREAVPGLRGKELLAGPMTVGELQRALEHATVRRTIGATLRQARHARDLTMSEAGDLAGVTAPRVARLEKEGGGRVEVQTLARIAASLGYDLQIALVPRGGGEALVADLRGLGAPAVDRPTEAAA